MESVSISMGDKLQIHGTECPRISFFEYGFAFAIPLVIGLDGAKALGEINVSSMLISSIIIGAILMMIYVQRKHTHVIQIDEDEYEELLKNYNSASISMVRISVHRNRFFEHNTSYEISFMDKCKNVASRYVLEAATFVVRAGGTRIDHLLDEVAYESLHGEWEYSLEQSNSTNERIVKALYLIPDSFNVILEFGYIGRYLSKIRRFLGVKSNDCPCGKGECSHDDTD